MQVRFHLPVWLGIGEALKSMIDSGKLDMLQVRSTVIWYFDFGVKAMGGMWGARDSTPQPERAVWQRCERNCPAAAAYCWVHYG